MASLSLGTQLQNGPEDVKRWQKSVHEYLFEHLFTWILGKISQDKKKNVILTQTQIVSLIFYIDLCKGTGKIQPGYILSPEETLRPIINRVTRPNYISKRKVVIVAILSFFLLLSLKVPGEI